MHESKAFHRVRFPLGFGFSKAQAFFAIVMAVAVGCGLAEEIKKTAPALKTDILWLEARMLCRRGDLLSDREALPVYREAYHKSQEAVGVNPQSAGAHYFLGLSSAKLARVSGPFSKFKYIRRAQREMKKVIVLDPGFSEAGAYRVLGKISVELPGPLGGSNQTALRYLRKAVALAPQNALNHLYLAQVLKATGDKVAARSEAFWVTAMPPEDNASSAKDDTRRQAEELLKSLNQ